MSGTKGGYGVMQKGRRGEGHIRAHRAAWLLLVGPPPEKPFELLHQCDNKRCVNPAHIRVGTRSENVREAYERGLRPYRPTVEHLAKLHAGRKRLQQRQHAARLIKSKPVDLDAPEVA